MLSEQERDFIPAAATARHSRNVVLARDASTRLVIPD
jgi:hypothetical protein